MYHSFHKQDLEAVRSSFSEKTGVALPQRHRYPRAGLILAVSLVCILGLSAFTFRLFSGLAGEDRELSLSAVYLGEGVVEITVENGSDVPLRFQPQIKLMRWSDGQEIVPLYGRAQMEHMDFPAQSSGVMTVDLSQAYDIAALEEPLGAGDWYYLVLTNHDFVFGHDWICGVDFAPSVPVEPVEKQLPEVWEALPDNPAAGRIVAAVDPEWLHIGGAEPFPEEADGDQIWGEGWAMRDAGGRLLATEEERAMEISVYLPSAHHQGLQALPLFYIVTYEKASINEETDCAFLCGQTVPFSGLAEYLVYEDGTYLCYEISPLVYSDLDAYAQDCAADQGAVYLADRVQTAYEYFQEHLPELIVYRDTPITRAMRTPQQR